MKRFLGLLILLLGFIPDHLAFAKAEVDLRLFPFGDRSYGITDAWDFHFEDGPDVRPLSIIAVSPRENNFGDSRHGTFKLRIKLPEAASQFSIFFPELRSASEVYINDRLVARHGQVGRTLDEEQPEMHPFIHRLSGSSNTVDITIRMSAYSNYQFMASSTPISVGYHANVYDKQQAAKIRDAFAVGAIFIMAFYHFSLFSLRRERIDPLLFGLFCVCIGMRTIVRSDGLLLYHLFEQPDFYWHYRIEYWGINLSGATLMWFMYVLFHRSISRTFGAIVIGLSLLYALLVGILPLWAHGVLLIPFEIFILGTAAYLVACIARAHPSQRDGAVLMATGFGLFSLSILNDILKNHGLMQTTTLSHIGLVAFILFQAIIISKRFSRAFTRVKETEFEIRQLNDDLEKKVKDRTQTIRVILDNVKAGFLLVGPDLKIKEGFTRSCRDIIGLDLQVGQPLLDLFDLNARERAHFQIAVDQIFADLLPADVSLSQIHSRVPIGSRVIALQGSIVREEDASVHAILFTMTDATMLVKAEHDARINQTLLSILQDKAAFQNFIGDSLQELQQARTALAAHDQTRVRLILHTLKGNFATYGLDDVSHAIHAIEDCDVITAEQVQAIEQNIQLFIRSYQDLIGLDLDAQGEKTARIPYPAFDHLRQLLQNLRASIEVQRVFDVWVQEVKLVPVRTLFGAMLTHAGRLAARLGKDVEFHVSGGETLVSPEKLGMLINSVTHLLNNAIDHGVEFPEKRGTKPPKARIDLMIRRDSSHFHISVSDDGQGLDLQHIGEVAAERGLMPPAAFAAASDRDKARCIFLPGFSTATAVSDVSGRGVGMSAVQDALERLHGTIEIHNEPGRGCRFEMKVPDQLTAPLIPKVA